MTSPIVVAAKCAPKREHLINIANAGLSAVELFLSPAMLDDISPIIELCREFPFRYALHAPNDGHNPEPLAELAVALTAEVVVFHNNFWEDEWSEIVELFKGGPSRLCLENIASIHEPYKFIRRYGMGRCLDLEHMIMECGGVFHEEFIRLMGEASHIHMTGYTKGSEAWHTHIHHAAKQSGLFLDMLKEAGYKGMVVSEARTSLQTAEEFRLLHDFFADWQNMSLK
jgi:sugar phosphate isomerase/epimerase